MTPSVALVYYSERSEVLIRFNRDFGGRGGGGGGGGDGGGPWTLLD